MKLIDLNARGGIGANCLYVEIGGFNLVIDSGLHPQHSGNDSLPALSEIDNIRIDFVILTHCHLDHLAALPVLMRRQPEAKILTSVPSSMLAGRLMHNSVNVMQRQRVELGDKSLPLYTHGEIDRIEHNMLALSFQRAYSFDKGADEITVILHPSGHIPGAAGIEIIHKHRRIFFTGDVSYTEQRILLGAHFPPGPFDTVVTETTRGRAPRMPGVTRASEVERMTRAIRETLDADGNVLLSVFALGRMQEVATLLHEARQRGELNGCPVFASGLGVDLADYFDTITKKTGLARFRKRVLKELEIKPMPRMSPGKPPRMSAIYLLSSGMLVENTPSYKAAAALLCDSRNTLCFPGYCDPSTPGGKLLETPQGKPFVFEALDYACEARARRERFDLSGHADRDELLDFICRSECRAVVLTHGDAEARDWFVDELTLFDPKLKVLNPDPLVSYSV